MLRFHFFLHPRPPGALASENTALAGRSVVALIVDPAEVAQQTFPVPFAAALAALEPLPRMFCEPDGAFVWVGSELGQTWQVDGNLFGRGDALAYAELKGEGPIAALENLRMCLAGASPVVLQTAQSGLYFDWAELLRNPNHEWL